MQDIQGRQNLYEALKHQGKSDTRPTLDDLLNHHGGSQMKSLQNLSQLYASNSPKGPSKHQQPENKGIDKS